MSTFYYARSRGSSGNGFFKFLGVLLFIVIIVFAYLFLSSATLEYVSLYGKSMIVGESYMLTEVALNNHAIERHGESAQKVADCINSKGVLFTMYNPLTGRTAHICDVEPGKWGVLITEGECKDCVTSFIKDKMKNIDKVIKYLNNVGYDLLH